MSLPLTATSSHPNRRARVGRASRIFTVGRQTEVTRRGLSLQLESTAFNATHDRWLESLSREDSGVGAALRSLYDFGAGIGLLGLVAGICFMVISLAQSVFPTASSSEPTAGESADGLTSAASGIAIFDHASSSQLRPIVPGFTVPFFHTPVILLALFASQIVHELGHAIAAAADAIPLHSVGASLALIIPSAHVALSHSEAFPLRSRLRVATAGAWHNLLAWLVLLFLTRLPISEAGFWTFGGYGLYNDVSTLGVSVMGLSTDSPLQGHILPASVITRLDDTRLSSSVATADTWDRYLIAPPTAKDFMPGWCVSRNWYKVQPSSCCKTTASNSTTSKGENGLCFVPPKAAATPSESTKTSKADVHLASGRCVDPIDLFQSPSEAAKSGEAVLSTSRCDTVCMSSSKNPNEEDEICIRPKEDLELLRITLLPPPWYDGGPSDEKERPTGVNGNTRTIVWNGPKEEVWQQLTVGRLRPRSSWVPVYLPVWVKLFIRYFQIITLSLFIFNLLPIPKLDGGVILGIVLDMIGSTLSEKASANQYEYSAEMMEKGEDGYSTTSSGSIGNGRMKRQVERWVGLGTIGLVGAVCMVSVWKEITAG